jgi:hypothetical protein
VRRLVSVGPPGQPTGSTTCCSSSARPVCLPPRPLVRGTENKIKKKIVLKKALKKNVEKSIPEHFRKMFRYELYQIGKLSESVPVKKHTGTL